MAVAAAPLVVPAAEALWTTIVVVGSALAAAVGIAETKKAVDENFSSTTPSATQSCPFAAQASYIPPPKALPGFPDAEPAKPKTPIGGGKLRRRWKTSDGDILEWDYQHGKVEKYDKRGKHQGEYDPETGEQTKPAEPDREVEP